MSRQIAKRILVGAVQANLEMQVRTGRKTGRPFVADRLTAADPVAGPHREAGHVAVNGAVTVPVGHDDDVPLATAPARARDHPTASRTDRGATACAEVNT